MKYFVLLMLMFHYEVAYGCRSEKTLTDSLKKKADIIFIGEIQDYSSSRLIDGGIFPAQLTFRIKEVEKGKLKSDSIFLHWVNGTFGESRDIAEFKSAYGTRTRVGLVYPKTYLEQCKEKEYVNAGTGRKTKRMSCSGPLIARPHEDVPKRPWVVQGPCTKPFMEKLSH